MRISDWSSDVCSSDLSDRALNLLISGRGEIAAVIAYEHDQILRRGGCGEKQLGGGRQSSWATGDDPVENGLIGFCRIAHHFEAVAIGFHLRAEIGRAHV